MYLIVPLVDCVFVCLFVCSCVGSFVCVFVRCVLVWLEFACFFVGLLL